MHIILGSHTYSGKHIPILELNSTIFAVRYMMVPIPRLEDVFYCSGVLIQSPQGDNPHYYEQPFILRLKYDRLKNDYTVDSDFSHFFPNINPFSTRSLTQKGTTQLSISSYSILEQNSGPLVRALNNLLGISYSCQNIKDKKRLVEFLAMQQSGGDMLKAQAILERYRLFKTIRLLRIYNYQMLGAGEKDHAKNFAHSLRLVYSARSSIPRQDWNDNLIELERQNNLLDKDGFIFDSEFIALQDALSKDGIIVDTVR
jgi:hypothetical protein